MKDLKVIQHHWHGSLKAYGIGFISSLVLTIISFLLVIKKPITGISLVCTLLGFALLQAVFQLIYFLHLGKEKKPYPYINSFLFAFFTLVIIVIGSLWIMHDLNIRMMPEMTEGH